MFEIIRDSFRITNKFIVLATPLIIFSLITSIYTIFAIKNSTISLVFGLIMFFLMLSAFLSGWFYMVKKCVTEPENDNVNSLITEFPSGVGEYFLPVCGMVIIVFLVGIIFLSISSFAGTKLIGDIGISPDKFSSAITSAEGIKEFLSSLTKEQLIKLNKWNFLLLFTMLISYFSVMFYPTALFFKEKNPLKMFFTGLKDLFGRRFLNNVILFLSIFSIYFVISILTTLAGKNIIANFIFTLVNFYYTVFAAVLLFNYYHKNYIIVGSNIDTRV